MKQIGQNSTSLILMVASMLLLAAFQVFWLRKEYNEQKSILQKETDILFKNTIQALEDSVIQRKISLPMKKMILPDSQVSIHKSKVSKPKFTFRYTQNSSPPPEHQVIRSMQERAKKMAYSEAFNMFYIQTAARMARSSGADTMPLASGDKLQDVLRKINPDNIRSININAVGNLDITKLTLADTTREGRSEIIIVKSHHPSDTLQKMVGRVAKVMMYNRPNRDSILSLMPMANNPNNLRVSVIERAEKQTFPVKVARKTKAYESHFVIRLDEDSLKIKDIKQNYGVQIRNSKINLPFQVTRRTTKAPSDSSAENGISDRTLSTSAVSSTMPFGTTYTAVFSGYEGFLLKKIIPQSLFSFFLLAITGLAFGAIYRNLRQQRRLTELKNDFISNVTHELKTPIATVSVAIEALQNFGAAQNPKQTKEYLEISKSELDRLTLLVDKVLKMATFEQQGLSLSLETIDLAEVIQTVLNSMKLQFEKYGAKVEFEKAGASFLTPADKIHLTNVIYNLLDNALKYSETNPQIALFLKETENEVHLSVSDKGIGIPKEYLDKVFDKFFRVPTGDTHDVKGYGLGLNYVSSVINQHRGHIKVESELGKGSTFTIKLPKP